MKEIPIIEKLKVMGRDLERMPIIKMLNIKRNFDRVPPLGWIFFVAVVFVVLGLIISFLELLFWLGGFIILVYLIGLVIWVKSKLR